MFTNLGQLNESKLDAKVRVRVSRLWLSVACSGVVKACNLIMLDEESYAIHAIIPQAVWKNLENLLMEGRLYDVSHFTTRAASGKLRPVRSHICISFSNHTTVQHVIENAFTIPFYKFVFSEIGHLQDIVASYPEDRSPEYCLDIIGFIQDLQQPTIIQTIYGPSELVQFVITDGRFSCKVNVWKNQVASVGTLFQDGLPTPFVVILAGARLCKFKGVVEISSLPCTRIYANLMNEDELRFRQRIAAEGFEA